MADSLTSYFNFAENDYQFFRSAYDSGLKGSALAALGQNICERYLKHVISEYANPDTPDEIRKKESILRTHSLYRLMSYISNDMEIQIPENTEIYMNTIDGFYFTTRYPGADSFYPTDRDIERANLAVENTRNFVLEICRNMELETVTENIDQNFDDFYDFDDR